MLITTKFDVGDDVQVGPHQGKIIFISIGQTITYKVCYWNSDGVPNEYYAYDFEITLLKSNSTRE